MAEETPLSYRLHFAAGGQELTTPNLFAPVTEYHADLSAGGARCSLRIQWSKYDVSYAPPAP